MSSTIQIDTRVLGHHVIVDQKEGALKHIGSCVIHCTMNFPTEKIFVGHLPRRCTNFQLEDHFSSYGRIVDCVVICGNGKPRGFGFITFTSTIAVDNCIIDYEKHSICEQWVEVKRAAPQNDLKMLPRRSMKNKPSNSVSCKNVLLEKRDRSVTFGNATTFCNMLPLNTEGLPKDCQSLKTRETVNADAIRSHSHSLVYDHCDNYNFNLCSSRNESRDDLGFPPDQSHAKSTDTTCHSLVNGEGFPRFTLTKINEELLNPYSSSRPCPPPGFVDIYGSDSKPVRDVVFSESQVYVATEPHGEPYELSSPSRGNRGRKSYESQSSGTASATSSFHSRHSNYSLTEVPADDKKEVLQLLPQLIKVLEHLSTTTEGQQKFVKETAKEDTPQCKRRASFGGVTRCVPKDVLPYDTGAPMQNLNLASYIRQLREIQGRISARRAPQT